MIDRAVSVANMMIGVANVLDYGAVGDGVTPSGGAINDAITALNTGAVGGGGTVVIPAGKYLIEETVTIPGRVRLLGTSTSSQGAYGGAVLVAADGLNDDVIATSGWWHWGEIAYLGIEGNSGNNSSGSGININQMGEASSIHHVQVLRCADHGFVVGGESTPTSLHDCSAMQNGNSGFYLDSVTRHISLINPSGDGNGDELITIKGTGAGPIAFVNIIGIKLEGGTAGTHEPGVLIDNYDGAVNFIGGTIDGNTGGTRLVGVQRTGANGGVVTFQGTRFSGYATQFKDDISSINTIALGTNAFTLQGVVGKTTFDISSGRHFSGRDAVTPTASARTAAGTGATASVGAGTDVRGTFTLTTGTSADTGSVGRITFGKAYASAPRLMLTAGNAAAAAVMNTVYTVRLDGTMAEFAVTSALTDSTEYQWDYLVMG